MLNNVDEITKALVRVHGALAVYQFSMDNTYDTSPDLYKTRPEELVDALGWVIAQIREQCYEQDEFQRRAEKWVQDELC